MYCVEIVFQGKCILNIKTFNALSNIETDILFKVWEGSSSPISIDLLSFHNFLSEVDEILNLLEVTSKGKVQPCITRWPTRPFGIFLISRCCQ